MKSMDSFWKSLYPPQVPYELPEVKKNLIELFYETCETYDDKTSFLSFSNSLSFTELKEEVEGMASFLQSLGLKKDDKIIIQLPNLIQYPISFWASVISGLTISKMNPLYTEKEMLHQIRETEAKACIILNSSVGKLKNIIKETSLEHVIVTGPGDLLSFPKKQIINLVYYFKTKPQKMKNQISFNEALKKGRGKKFNKISKGLDEEILIEYTGGTTGVSKGTVISQKNLISNAKQAQAWIKPYLIWGEERCLAPLPLYHIFAFVMNSLVFFFSGFSNLLIANPRDIKSLIKAMKKHPPSAGLGVNTLFKALVDNPEFKTINFKNSKVFVNGGMALEEAVAKKWNKITGSNLVCGYGLTEASPIVTCGRLDQEFDGSVGLPFPSTKLRITRGDEVLGLGEEGELEVSGPQVMKGYFKNEEATKLVIKDGWLKTGDIAKIEKKGLYILDRKKDMINVSGLKVYPLEVEAHLLTHHEIKEAVVTQFINEKGEESVKAFVVGKGDKTLNLKEVQDFCRKSLAAYKIPRSLEYISEIPKNILGKPLRRVLRDRK